MHCPGLPGGTQHCWPELFLKKKSVLGFACCFQGGEGHGVWLGRTGTGVGTAVSTDQPCKSCPLPPPVPLWVSRTSQLRLAQAVEHLYHRRSQTAAVWVLQGFGFCVYLGTSCFPCLQPAPRTSNPLFQTGSEKKQHTFGLFLGSSGCLASDGFWQLLCCDQMSWWHPGLGFSPHSAWSLSCLPWGSVWHPGLCLCGAGRGYPAEWG